MRHTTSRTFIGGECATEDGSGFGVCELADGVGDRGAVTVGAFDPEPRGVDLTGGDLDGLAHE